MACTHRGLGLCHLHRAPAVGPQARCSSARPSAPLPSAPPPRPGFAEHAVLEKADKRHTHTVALRNLSRDDVRRELWWLASSQGRPQSSRAPPRRVISGNPSIQGGWSVTTFAAAAGAGQRR